MSVAKTAKERKALEQKWRSGSGTPTRGQRYTANAPLFRELLIEDPPSLPITLRCSFCRKPVEESEATRGIVLNRGVLKLERNETDEGIEVEEKLRMLPDKVIACSDCSLKVQKQKFLVGD